MTKKIFCFILCLGLIFLSACNKSQDTGSSDISSTASHVNEKPKDSLNLLYTKSDSFNPYTAQTEINRQISKLLYEPLIAINDKYEVSYRLAESASMEGNIWTVKLRDALFTDTTSVTADDVIYCFNIAKASATIYSSQLASCTKVTADDPKTLKFTVSKIDPYFINLLDFPIFKSGTESKLNSDSVEIPPTGSGRYYVNPEGTKLILNGNYYGKKGAITQINFVNAPDAESINHYVEIGAADLYFTDISDGKIVRMSGKKIDVNLNNIVYIGMNDSYGLLESTYLRQAISSALDRSKICYGAYYNNAVPAKGFFNPAFETVKSIQNISKTTNMQITIENLEKIGYNSLDNNGYRVNSAGNKLSFSLLVNTESTSRVLAADMIAELLKDAGIQINVQKVPFDQYKAALDSNNFQMYLGEVKVLNNFDISGLVLKGGTAAYGIGLAPEKKNDAADKADTPEGENPQDVPAKPAGTSDVINGFYSGNNTIVDIENILQTEMPIIPVCYRRGILFYNENIENVKSASVSDIYFSIQSYTLKK